MKMIITILFVVLITAFLTSLANACFVSPQLITKVLQK